MTSAPRGFQEMVNPYGQKYQNEQTLVNLRTLTWHIPSVDR